MDDLADNHHLERRGDIWHYRRRVPRPLVAAFGKEVLRHSLQTSSLKQARRRRNELNVQYERQFAEIEAKLSSKDAENNWRPQPSLGVLIDRVRDEVLRQDHDSADSLRKDPPESEVQRQEMLADAKLGLSVLQDRDNPNAAQATYTTARRIIQSPEQLEHAVEFFEVIRRGLVEVERRRIDRLEGNHSGHVYDALFSGEAPRYVTFGELAEIYWAERVEDLTGC